MSKAWMIIIKTILTG